MNFESMFANCKNQMSPLYFIKDLISWSKPNGVLSPSVDYDKLPTLNLRLELAAQLQIGGQSAVMRICSLSEIFCYGPKVIRLNDVDFTILEKTDINLLLSDYEQPFRTIIIELPDNYSLRKEVADPESGQDTAINKFCHEETHRPLFVSLTHYKDTSLLLMMIFLSSGSCFTMFLSSENKTLEEAIKIDLEEQADHKSDPITDEERICYSEVFRASLNAALYVMDYGMTKTTDGNKKKERLQHFVKVAERSGDKEKITKARQNLRHHPTTYILNQDVRLQVTHERCDRKESGIIITPHWRRGHYRLQACGPGRSLRKRIRIAPVLINGHLFKGDEKDTIYTLRDK